MSSKHRLVALVGAGLTVVALTAATVGSASADDGLRIQIRDDCDPTTFNLAVRPGACVGHGETTFDAFINELIATHTVKKWAFKPDQAEVKAGQMVVATNRGGETHSFTCVTQFGGGIIADLNKAGGFSTPAVPCVGEDVGRTFIPSGGYRNVPVGSPGTAMYQCFIHPWMRTTLRVENS
jgi:plastocyanin